MIRNSFVPQSGHTPCMAGRPFFMVTSCALAISFFALHFTQYASATAFTPLWFISPLGGIAGHLIWLSSRPSSGKSRPETTARRLFFNRAVVTLALTILPVAEGMVNGLTKQRPARTACWLDRCLCIGLSGLAMLILGCGQSTGLPDADLERNPHYQKARKMSEQRDYKAAAAFYEKALLASPGQAKLHLEIGLLYDDKLGDPISAIYHYRHYLELQPDSDQRQLVEDFIERAKLSLASKLPQSPIVDPAELTRLQSEKAALLQENSMLKTRLAEVERTVPSVAPVAPPPAPVPVVAAAAAVEPGNDRVAARTHLVQRGDTLQSLALRYYGTRSGWEKIFQANRAILPSKDQLRVGQELVIP